MLLLFIRRLVGYSIVDLLEFYLEDENEGPIGKEDYSGKLLEVG